MAGEMKTVSHVKAPRLRLENITKTYSIGRGEVSALRDISIVVEPNEFVAIMGVSGSGKSTLLHILGCLDPTAFGIYEIDGISVGNLSSNTRARYRKETFGYIFQNFALVEDLSAKRNVLLPSAYSGLSLKHSSRVADALLDAFGLTSRSRHYPSELSGGQQQRVAIARALMNDGAVILADEPTASLDAEMTSEIMSILSMLHADGRTVVISTHDPTVAAFAQRVITLKDGVVVNDVRQKQLVPDALNNKMLKTALGHHETFRYGALNQFIDAAYFSFHQLRSNLLRTALTIIGIVIGSASFITMVGVGEGSKRIILEKMTNMGADLLFVVPMQMPSRGGDQGGTLFTLNDLAALSEVPNVRSIAPETIGNVVYRYGGKDHQAYTVATTPTYLGLKRRHLLSGTFFSNKDVFQLQPVAVVGISTARALFGNEQLAIGKYIVANNVLLNVIGVLAADGTSQSGKDTDDIVIIPLDTGRRRVVGQDGISVINIQVSTQENIFLTQTQVEQVLKKTRPLGDFRVHNMSSLIKAAGEAKNSMALLLAAIASLSLFVGGIGIMNVMLMSGLERSKEIGIRMAYGANEREIRQLFAAEALFLSFIGGVFGCLIGISASLGLNEFGITIYVSPSACLSALFFSIAVGLLFGYWPARQAAKRSPVDLLCR
ncbi:ABC transporter permease [Agrobacterium fabrum]|uniref:ABC transporter permease n=1 Tax=Agrobacterium fabrum TaxID=1176649 RepID=UPI003BA14566